MTRSRIQCNICSGDRLSGYLDGTLNVDLMRRIGAHLKECQECFHEYEKLEQTKRMLASLKDQTPQLTPEFMSAALRAVRQSRLPTESLVCKTSADRWNGGLRGSFRNISFFGYSNFSN